jgi:hypothetical protein
MLYGEHKSPRGFSLFYSEHGCDVPVLTVEAYEKWYELFLVHPDGRVESISFNELERFCGDGSPYADHAPNPNAVRLLVEARGWRLSELTFELMIGRWELALHPERYE